MTANVAAGDDLARDRSRRSMRQYLSEQPIIPLAFLLVLLVGLLIVVQPGILTRPQGWLTATVRTATPLALLAASQTLVMLTGGIDLSVATVASMSAYVMATQATSNGDPAALVLALLVAAFVGLINGVGIGIFRVQPLIMTLGTGLVALGVLTVYQKYVITAGSRVPESIATIGSGTTLGWFPNAPPGAAAGVRGHHRRAAPIGIRPDAVRRG